MPSFSLSCLLIPASANRAERLSPSPWPCRVATVAEKTRPLARVATCRRRARFTLISTVSSSQSTRIRFTSSRFPDVSPFVHSLPRVRLKNVAKPVSRRLAQRLVVHEADHQHFAGAIVLDDRRNQSIELRKIHDCPCCRKTKKASPFPARPRRMRVLDFSFSACAARPRQSRCGDGAADGARRNIRLAYRPAGRAVKLMGTDALPSGDARVGHAVGGPVGGDPDRVRVALTRRGDELVPKRLQTRDGRRLQLVFLVRNPVRHPLMVDARQIHRFAAGQAVLGDAEHHGQARC